MENIIGMICFLVIITTASLTQQVQGSPRSPLVESIQETRQGASAGIAGFLNGFITGLTSAFQGGVAGAGDLFNGFGSAANNTFSGLLAGYNSTAQALVGGVSSFIGNTNRSRT